MTVKMKRTGKGRHAAYKAVTVPTQGYAMLAVAVGMSVALSASPYLFRPSPAFATAAPGVTTSVQSFTPGVLVQRQGGDEPSRSGGRAHVKSVSTSVPMDTDWGGIEKLDVPVTRSTAQQTAASGLKAAIDAAAPVYDSSAGRLSSRDGHLRDDLKARIDTGNAMLGNVETSENDMNSQAGAINEATAAIGTAIQGYASEGYSQPSRASRGDQAAVNAAYEQWLQSHQDASLGARVLQYAMTFNGHRYVWGAAGPDVFDCSGLVMYSYAHFGVRLPHFSGAQATMGIEVPPSDMRPGDVLANNEHAALYYGKINGEDYVFNAANPSEGVKLSPLRWAFSSPYHIRRMG